MNSFPKIIKAFDDTFGSTRVKPHHKSSIELNIFLDDAEVTVVTVRRLFCFGGTYMNDFFERAIVELNSRCTLIGARVQEIINEISMLKHQYINLQKSFDSLKQEYENLLSLILEK